MIKSLILASSMLLPIVNWNTSRFTEQEAAIRKEFFTAGRLPYPGNLSDPNGVHVPCCGEGDAYEADELKVDEGGNLIAILTCNDPRNCVSILGKVERPAGTEIAIPELKILIPGKPLNNTGHGWVFIGITTNLVICYSRPPGI